jgi:hypothetical protein
VYGEELSPKLFNSAWLFTGKLETTYMHAIRKKDTSNLHLYKALVAATL